MLTGSFGPSREFEPYLLSYCSDHLAEPNVADAAAFVMGRVAKLSSMGPRREVPTSIEIEACKALDPVLVRVYHLDGTFDTLPVTSWMSPLRAWRGARGGGVAACRRLARRAPRPNCALALSLSLSHAVLKEMVCQVRGIRDGVPYALYEMTPTGEERYLEADECVLDVIAFWQRLSAEEKDASDGGGAAKKAVAGLHFYRIVFKVHMYFDPPADDAAAQHELYVQAVYDVVTARYPCEEKDVRALAALQLQAECGDAGAPDLADHLAHFLPAKALPKAGSRDADELLADLRRQHAALAGRPPAAAAADYLRTIKTWQVYGSSFFLVEPQMSADLPADVFLAVNPKGIIIINPETRATIAFYPYAAVPTWGHSGASFVMHIGAQHQQQTKLYFGTPDGQEINDLVRSASRARAQSSRAGSAAAIPARAQRAHHRRRHFPTAPSPRAAGYVNYLCAQPTLA